MDHFAMYTQAEEAEAEAIDPTKREVLEEMHERSRDSFMDILEEMIEEDYRNN